MKKNGFVHLSWDCHWEMSHHWSVREAATVFSVTYSRIGQNLLVQDDATDVPNT